MSERAGASGLRLISWNVAGRVAKLTDQVRAVLGTDSHVVALQEITARTLPVWRAELESAGYAVVSSLDAVPDRSVLAGGRRYGVLVASVFSLTPLSGRLDVPWPERVLSAVTTYEDAEIEVHNAHLPAGVSHGYVKVETFEGISSGLAGNSDKPRILCGDFNSPREELEDGTTVPFGGGDERWKAAELGVIRDLGDHDLADVFRGLHGYGREEASWAAKRKGSSYGRRFDHVFAARSLGARTCRYLHDYREGGLSDHSPIVAEFDPVFGMAVHEQEGETHETL